MADTFTCDECGATHEKGWSDEDALAESLRDFGPMDPDDIAVICDDCYRELIPWAGDNVD